MQTSWQTYKNSVSSIKLGYKTIKKKQSGPKNLIIKIKHHGLQG